MERRGRVRSSARLSAHGGAAAAAAAASGAAAVAAAAAAEARAAAAAAERAARRAREAARQAEVEDSPRVLRDKCRRLARAIKNAKHLVVYTGAGVSTAAAIPDYRGPRGVWTRLARGEAAPRVDVARATPTYTHMALAALARARRLRFLVSQNCDGLHLRAGTPRRRLAELHGNMFLERCPAPRCRRVYVRTFDTSARTRRHAHGTRRLCHTCGRELRDTIVHFGERGRAAWPLHWAGALRHAAAADVVLCLGSSLKVLRRYPRLWSMHRPAARRPALYIVNLQWTPKDRVCALKINARCDDVLRQVARRLRLRVPRYSPRRDPLRAHATPLAPPERHTARAAERPPAAARSVSPSSLSSSPSSSPASSPSATDSEDDRPLQLLATRTRPNFTSFQVNLRGGEATILLRPEHAAPAPALSDLRRFRMPKRELRALDDKDELRALDDKDELRALDDKDELRALDDKDDNDELKPLAALLQQGAPPKAEGGCEARVKLEGAMWSGCEFKAKQETGERLGFKPPSGAWGPVKQERATPYLEADALARRIIERAVRLCRARLYPGLHTILAPPAPPPQPPPPPLAPQLPAECAWCWERHKSRRCLWYPARDALSSRVWRRVRGRRYLCACCPREEAGAGAGAEVDEPGWYGKGYRKGRRRRR